MHDDPLIFAMRDHGCRVTIIATAGITALAHFIN